MESKPRERKVDISVFVGWCGDEGDVCRLVGVSVWTLPNVQLNGLNLLQSLQSYKGCWGFG
jgi:hypothetical protein